MPRGVHGQNGPAFQNEGDTSAYEKAEASKNREVMLRQEIDEFKSKVLKLEKRASRTEANLIQGALDGVVSQLKAEFRKPAESVKS